jgi:hypothetical protein
MRMRSTTKNNSSAPFKPVLLCVKLYSILFLKGIFSRDLRNILVLFGSDLTLLPLTEHIRLVFSQQFHLSIDFLNFCVSA